jgi:hypothetical protein
MRHGNLYNWNLSTSLGRPGRYELASFHPAGHVKQLLLSCRHRLRARLLDLLDDLLLHLKTKDLVRRPDFRVQRRSRAQD